MNRWLYVVLFFVSLLLAKGGAYYPGTVTGTVDFDYDDLLRLSETSVNGAHHVCFEYDNNGLLQGVGHSVEGSCTIDLAIDLHDGEADETNSGLIDETSLGSVTTRYVYNDLAEVEDARRS